VTIAPALLVGYLLGSIPFGLLLTRAAGVGDLRRVGSGNIGATNVLRTGRKGLAAATLLLDGGKALGAVLLARAFWPGTEALAGAAAVMGHCFPVWLGFRGGKGVATLFGVTLGLGWPIGLACAVAWIAVIALGRISSLAGLSAAVTAPVAAWSIGESRYAALLAAVAVLVFWQHRENLVRLRAGTEPKVGSAR
jgi:glycerol-3-phosphate acyltransferase PlsY